MPDDLIQSLADAIQQKEGKPGDRNYRNFNPGNLREGPGMTGLDPDGYAIFPNEEAGMDALKDQIHVNIGRGLNLNEFFGGKGDYKGYAPKGDNNDPVAYAKEVADKLGIDPSTPLTDATLGSRRQMPDQEEMQTVKGPDGQTYTFPKSQAKAAMTAMRRRATPEQLGAKAPPTKQQGMTGLPVAAPLQKQEPSGFAESTGRDILQSVPFVPPAMAAYRSLKGQEPFDPRSGYGRGMTHLQEGATAFFNPKDHGIQRGITNLIKGTGELAQTPALVGLIGSGAGALRSGGLGGLTKEAAELGTVGGVSYGLGRAGEAIGRKMGWSPETQEMLGAIGESIPIGTLGFKPEWVTKPTAKFVEGLGKVVSHPASRMLMGQGLAEVLVSRGVPRGMAEMIGEGLGLGTSKQARKMMVDKGLEYTKKFGRAFRGEPEPVPTPPTPKGTPPPSSPGPVRPPMAQPPNIMPEASKVPPGTRPGPVRPPVAGQPAPPPERPKSNYSYILDAIDEGLRQRPGSHAVPTPTPTPAPTPTPTPPPSSQMPLPFEQAPPLRGTPEQMRQAAAGETPKPPGPGELTESQQAQRTTKASRLAEWAAANMEEITEAEIRAKAKIHEWRKTLGKAAGLSFIPSEQTVHQMIPKFLRLKEYVKDKIKEGSMEFIDQRPSLPVKLVTPSEGEKK